ncbi:MAG: hypothetical protein GZ091_05720 [Paludibacter sp.]|nr:hypothetical protein [Paludibacter sp.]
MAHISGITITKNTRGNDFDLIINYKKNPELVTSILDNNNMKNPISPYDPKFVAKIKKSEKQIAEGKVHKLDMNDIWK